GAVVGHVRDGNTLPPGRGHVHVVVAHAAADDEPAAPQPADGPFGHTQRVVDQYRVGVVHVRLQVLLALAIHAHQLRDVAQHLALEVEGFHDQVRNHHLCALPHQFNSYTALTATSA